MNFKIKQITSRSYYKYAFPPILRNKLMPMKLLIKEFWKLNRTAVNEDTDKLIFFLKDKLNANIIEAKSGEECLTWIIPCHWKVYKAFLKKKDGTVIADFYDNPLYLWTHSVSFKGNINRNDLINEHISSDPNRPNEIIYNYTNGYIYNAKEWGFSLPYKIMKNLQDDVYDVEIDAELDNNGTLKVIDSFLPGKKKETIFFIAHTCHPAQVCDGIANIAIAVELYLYLKSLNERKFSYRFIFGPEYFAAATYLAKSKQEDIKNLYSGIFLDMLSNHEPLVLQHSMQGKNIIDRAVENVFKSHLQIYIEQPYRKLWGNDEMFYNGAGFSIPTIGIARGMFREYHYSSDNLENMDEYHLIESLWILKRIINLLELDYIPERTYKGPIYLRRYSLDSLEPEIMEKLEEIQVLIDGNNSCLDIASKLELDFFDLHKFLEKLVENNLIIKKD